MMDVKVFIACHKLCEVPTDPLYLPIQVGAFDKENIGFVRDDTGDNISDKNPIFCELTGLYWCWKNLQYDYLGLVHYRRYFSLKIGRKYNSSRKMNRVLNADEAEELLSKYRIIVPRKRHYFIESVYNHYSNTFSKEQLDETRDILIQKYPEFVSSWDDLMMSSKAYIFNMFIMSKELVDDYCTWLFDVLFELEKRIDTSFMTDFEKRYAGRVGERLFNAWMKKKISDGSIAESDIKEIPYLYIGKVDWKNKIISFLMAKFFHRKYKKSF